MSKRDLCELTYRELDWMAFGVLKNELQQTSLIAGAAGGFNPDLILPKEFKFPKPPRDTKSERAMAEAALDAMLIPMTG